MACDGLGTSRFTCGLKLTSLLHLTLGDFENSSPVSLGALPQCLLRCIQLLTGELAWGFGDIFLVLLKGELWSGVLLTAFALVRSCCNLFCRLPCFKAIAQIKKAERSSAEEELRAGFSYSYLSNSSAQKEA